MSQNKEKISYIQDKMLKEVVKEKRKVEKPIKKKLKRDTCKHFIGECMMLKKCDCEDCSFYKEV